VLVCFAAQLFEDAVKIMVVVADGGLLTKQQRSREK